MMNEGSGSSTRLGVSWLQTESGIGDKLLCRHKVREIKSNPNHGVAKLCVRQNKKKKKKAKGTEERFIAVKSLVKASQVGFSILL